MRIVSLLVPIRGGIYQFHHNLLKGIAARDIELTWLCSGSANAALITEENADLSNGEVVAQGYVELAHRTKALVDRIVEISPDLLLCHARGDPIDLNAVRYLPAGLRRILVVHGSTLAVYHSAQAVGDHVSITVAISPRIQQDLKAHYGFHDRKVTLIPHGIDTPAFASAPLRDNLNGPIRILSHGRIDRNKGVFLLPKILSDLARHSSNWLCTISGDGPDQDELRRRMAREGLMDKVQFTGWTAPNNVPQLMNQNDVFLFPTKYEGYPLALLEAMAGGCAPISSQLPAITDWVIEEAVNGFLFPIGNHAIAAQRLLELTINRSTLNRIRRSARESAKAFSLDAMSTQYLSLFSDVSAQSTLSGVPEQLNSCELSDGLKPAFWYRLPEPLKDQLREVRERVRRFIPVR